MEAHFHYHIKFIMNVTDIDDKIIKRARLNHLRDQYLSSTPDDTKVNPLSGQRLQSVPQVLYHSLTYPKSEPSICQTCPSMW